MDEGVDLSKYHKILQELLEKYCSEDSQNWSIFKKSQFLTHVSEAFDHLDKDRLLFIANMSYEIRTPLNAILGFSEILVMHLSRNASKEKSLEAIAQIEKAVKTLADLVKNILRLSEIISNTTEYSTEKVYLKVFCEEVLEENAEATLNKKLDFLMEIAPDCPDFFYVDRSIIAQILRGLLDNAIKFSYEHGSVSLSIFKDSNDSIVFAVKDEGIGILEDDFKKIFEPFYKSNNSLKEKREGGGLGLALVKKLVEFCRGKIWVKSKASLGTTFYVSIPFRNAKVDRKEKLLDYSKVLNEGKSVLIVEDSLVNQRMLTQLLGLVGIKNIYVASNGKEGVDMVKSIKPSLVFMDLHMPVMGGIAAIQNIRALPDKEYAKIPIVVFTADVTQKKKGLVKKIGINDYLLKPIEIGELKRIIKKYLIDREECSLKAVGKEIKGIEKEKGEKILLQLAHKRRCEVFFQLVSKLPFYQGAKILLAMEDFKQSNIKFKKEDEDIFDKIETAIYHNNEADFLNLIDKLKIII